MKQKGFVRIILLLVIALAILSALGFDVAEIIKSPEVRETQTGVSKHLASFVDTVRGPWNAYQGFMVQYVLNPTVALLHILIPGNVQSKIRNFL